MITSFIDRDVVWRRFVGNDSDAYQAMYWLGSAQLFALQTTRPAFVEMIDTLRWEDLL